MRGDFSRWTFDPTRAVSRVLQQQGRVVLDADWNEQAAVQLHLLRRLAGDLIGPHGGPLAGLGFGITPVPAANTPDLEISSGRYYVDGIMCDLASRQDAAGLQTRLRYSAQPFLVPDPQPPALPEEPYLVYLDVWEQLVTGLENGDQLDAALGGADTCVRAEVRWQVRTHALTWTGFSPPVTSALSANNLRCQDIDDATLAQLRDNLSGGARGALKVQARKSEETLDACLTPPDNRYQGTENQLYRVEIHQGGTAAEATFKWSRENGSVVFAGHDVQDKSLQVSGVRDTVHGLRAGDWVELTSPGQDWMGQPGELVQLAQVDGNDLKTDGPLPGRTPEARKGPLLVRRWDQQERDEAPMKNGAVPIQESTDLSGWTELEDGIHIQFQPGAHRYRSGDYWIFPARTATGDVQWPQAATDVPMAVPPMGVEHHCAPLAVVTAGAATDLRRVFRGLAACQPV